MTGEIEFTFASGGGINFTLAGTAAVGPIGPSGPPGPSYVESDTPFPLNGSGGNTYFKFNSSTGKVEVWVLGVKKGTWG